MAESSPNYTRELRRLEDCIDDLIRTLSPDDESGRQSFAGHIGELRSISEELRRGIGARQRAEEDHRKIAALVENSNDFIGLATLEGNALFVNPAGQAMLGLRDDAHVQATNVRDYLPAKEQDRLRDEILPAVAAAGRWGGEMHFRHFETGALIPMLAQIFFIREAGSERPLALATISRDITERKRAEEAAQKAQAELARVTRITAMGELAASIAHELNQPLGAIVNNSNTCLRLCAHQRRPKPEWREALVDIGRDAARASEIIQRIRTLGQQTTERWTPLQLGSVLGTVLALVRPELAKQHLVVEASMSRRLPNVIGNGVQLQQVFLNLIMNAIEAVSAAPESARRTIAVAGRRSRLGERAAVLISVSDSGPGITGDVAARLFEPFFTTKPQGTGMGLRISRSIVEAHGGQLWLLPDQHDGTTFCFALPAGDKAGP